MDSRGSKYIEVHFLSPPRPQSRPGAASGGGVFDSWILRSLQVYPAKGFCY